MNGGRCCSGSSRAERQGPDVEISEILVNVVFYVFAAFVAGGAIAVASSRNIVRSAFSLLSVLFGAAALE